MKEIVLDTETTGLSVRDGHRIVEIGCIELDNLVPTKNIFHVYLNPERKVSEKAFEVHGYSDEFLATKQKFSEIVDDFLEFIGNKKIIIHNAEFDIGHLNNELTLIGKQKMNISNVIDTLELARNKYPGSGISLDALCRRFKIDNSDRELHGALKDARILSKVYFELLGGSQTDLKLINDVTHITPSQKNKRAIRAYDITAEEKRDHEKFLEKIKNPIWLN